MDSIYLLTAGSQIVVTVVGGIILFRLQDYSKQRDQTAHDEEREDRAIQDGVCALLRDRIMQACLHFEKIGYIPPRELESLSRMYSAYHNLGGNDVITAMYREVQNLPHSEEARA